MDEWVLHVDLDQFIAAVELLRRPELRGRPVIVGGDGDPSRRGVVAAASYRARARGVHSGLALRTAARRCPDAAFLPVDRPVYEAASDVFVRTLRGLDAVVEVAGWDEAFLAVRTDDPEAFADQIRCRVREATGLECSVGIGENKLRAKIATGFGKPAGVFRLTARNWNEVMGDLRPDALWGVGRKTTRRLAGLGITTVSALAAASTREVAAEFGPAAGPALVALARGLGSSQVTAEAREPRSHGREVTFQHDIEDWEQVRSHVARIARRLAGDLARTRHTAVRIGVTVRYAPFVTKTHGAPLATPTRVPDQIEAAAIAALDEGFRSRDPVRLVGVRAELARDGQGHTSDS